MLVRKQYAETVRRSERRFVSELGRIDGCDREAFEACDRETKAIAVLGSRKWPGQAKFAVDRRGQKQIDPDLAENKEGVGHRQSIAPPV